MNNADSLAQQVLDADRDATAGRRDEQGRRLTYCGGGMTDIGSHHAPHQIVLGPNLYDETRVCTGDPNEGRDADTSLIALYRTAAPTLARRVQAVLALHAPVTPSWAPSTPTCAECIDQLGFAMPYPCPTVVALGGPDA